MRFMSLFSVAEGTGPARQRLGDEREADSPRKYPTARDCFDPRGAIGRDDCSGD